MLAISVAGIFILLVIIKFSTPESVQIPYINSLDVGKEVKITGEIISFKEYENNFKILQVKNDGDRIAVICNCIEIKPYLNKTLEITGKIEEYKGQLQINANKISILK